MPSQREHYEQWIGDFLKPRFPELVPQFLMALEAFDVAMKSGVLTNRQLETIVESAHSPRKPLAENVAALLGELAARFAVAQQAVREMAAHPKVHVRVNALVALSSMNPTGLHDEVLRTALKDRSSKVRALAADKIMQFGLRYLLPEIEEATTGERDPETRAVLERERDLLRDGYHLHPHDDGSISISCRLPSGGTKSTFVAAEDLQKRGAREIAKSLGAEVPPAAG